MDDSSIAALKDLEDFALPRVRKSLGEEAADRLREFILLERLVPGMAINERDLAAALGISRTPLREALQILAIEGLVEYSSTRRPRVAAPSLEEIIQNLQVMSSLEELAGKLACHNASDEQIERIQDLNEKMQRGSTSMDPLAFFRTDMNFHVLIVEASGNLPLTDTHRQYNARLWRARFLSSQRKVGRADTLQQHNEIAAAIASRDAARTSQAMSTHIASAIVNVSRQLGE
ncbi:MAG: transcriptional regulator [Pelagibacterium sp. SCN 64-44]|nr:MAG: transcriptional regulator [Pelagibacterium sp. SCN 64-44]